MKKKINLLITLALFTFILAGCKTQAKEETQEDEVEITTEIQTTEAATGFRSTDQVKDPKIKEILEMLRDENRMPDTGPIPEEYAIFLFDWLYESKDANFEEVDSDFFAAAYAITALASSVTDIILDDIKVFPLPDSNIINVELNSKSDGIISCLNIATVIDHVVTPNTETAMFIRKPYSHDLYAVYFGQPSGTGSLYQAGNGSDFLEDMLRFDALYVSDEYVMQFNTDSKSDNIFSGIVGPFQAGAMDFNWTGGLKLTDSELISQYEMESPYGKNYIDVHRFAINMDGTFYYLVAPNVNYITNVITTTPHLNNVESDTTYFDLTQYADGIVSYVHEVGGEVKEITPYELTSIKSIADGVIEYNAINHTTTKECIVILNFEPDRVIVGTQE